MTDATLQGLPRELDTLLKPLARRLIGILGALMGLILVGLKLWLWVPVPFLLLTIVSETTWWIRRDRSIRLILEAERLTLIDPTRRMVRRLFVRDVQAVNIWFRPHETGTEVHVATLGQGRVTFCATMRCDTDAFHPQSTDIDVRQWEAIFGEIASIRNTVAAPEACMRQILVGPTLLEWFRTVFSHEAHASSWARVWYGQTPPLSLFGFHIDPHDATFFGRPDGGCSSPDGEPFTLPMAPTMRSERTIALLNKTTHGPQAIEGTLPLGVFEIEGGGRLVCPTRDFSEETTDLRTSDAHTHASEAMALLAHAQHHHRVSPSTQGMNALRATVDKET